MPIRAFLFDLDGTLIDTEQTWAVAIRQYLTDRGFPVSTDEILRLVFGHSWFDIYRKLCERFPPLSGTAINDVSAALRGYYQKLCTDPESQVIRSSVETLCRLSELAPCCIVSGSCHDDVEDAARRLGIAGRLAFILGAEDYERGKPAPDCYLEASKRLGVPPADCVVFEDSPAGVLSAKNAGMRCVALDRCGLATDQLNPLADLVLSDLSAFRTEML
ncbi:MAG: HAD family phosphatase [Kiritimatiellae bacterium]|nr:HAD family phosphatase [Kiritimatiellia bacterium]